MNDVVGRLCADEDAPKVGDVEGDGVTGTGAVVMWAWQNKHSGELAETLTAHQSFTLSTARSRKQAREMGCGPNYRIVKISVRVVG